MKTLHEYIHEARAKKVAIGHFNISNTEGMWAVFRAAQKLDVPVIIGVSEGEREYLGVRQVVAVIKSLREEYNYPVFLNADHTYSVEKVKQALDAGFDSAIFDGAQLPFEENVKKTKECVDYAKKVNPNALIEGELGYIGTSSKLLDAVPDGVVTSGIGLTTKEQALDFVKQTGVHLLAPAVGNVHGMMKVGHDPRLDIARVSEISTATGVPLVLHGGSGTVDEDFVSAIKAGVSIVHISTELRVAFRKSLELTLQANPEEIAPYKFMKETIKAMEKVAFERLTLFQTP